MLKFNVHGFWIGSTFQRFIGVELGHLDRWIRESDWMFMEELIMELLYGERSWMAELLSTTLGIGLYMVRVASCYDFSGAAAIGVLV